MGPFFPRFAPPGITEESWDDVGGRFMAKYEVNDSMMIFGSYTQAKSGGFDGFWIEDANGGCLL